MAYTNFIAAIDLGTSHMVGMVGTKGVSGALSIIAYEVEYSENCIRRGCVLNIKETASKIRRLVLKLENKLDGAKIAKVYIGVGGQSLHSITYPVSKMLGNSEVTEALLRDLDRECRRYQPELEDVLDVVSPVYYLDNRLEKTPEGMIASRIEAHYQLIVGRPSLRHTVTTNMKEPLRLDIAGIIVAPLALADLILTDREKERGCALIDFGAGVTTVTMFKNGSLVGLSVIPLGSHLITRDLMSLNISEKEAERIKRTYGSARWEKENGTQAVSVSLAEGWQSGEVRLAEINEIVEARSREIIENVYARIVDAGMDKEPGFGIVIAGNGSALKNLREAISERFKMEVNYASVRKDRIESGEMIANNPECTMAVALLLKGSENCALHVAPEPEVRKPEPEKVAPVESKEQPLDVQQEAHDVTDEPPRRNFTEGRNANKRGGGLFGGLKDLGKKLEGFGGELFKDEDYNR